MILEKNHQEDTRMGNDNPRHCHPAPGCSKAVQESDHVDWDDAAGYGYCKLKSEHQDTSQANHNPVVHNFECPADGQ